MSTTDTDRNHIQAGPTWAMAMGSQRDRGAHLVYNCTITAGCIARSCVPCAVPPANGEGCGHSKGLVLRVGARQQVQNLHLQTISIMNKHTKLVWSATCANIAGQTARLQVCMAASLQTGSLQVSKQATMQASKQATMQASKQATMQASRQASRQSSQQAVCKSANKQSASMQASSLQASRQQASRFGRSVQVMEYMEQQKLV